MTPGAGAACRGGVWSRAARLTMRDIRRYLVTGSAGFIGSHLAEALLARGDVVIGVDAFTDYYGRELKEANVDAIGGDVNFELVELELAVGTLEPLVARVGGAFHL